MEAPSKEQQEPSPSQIQWPLIEADPLLRQSAIALVAITGAWLFHLYSQLIPTPIVIAIWLGTAWLIGRGLYHRRRIRRRAWLMASLKEASPWHPWLRGGICLRAYYAFIGGLLALVLLPSLSRLQDSALWMLLLAAGLALVIVRLRVEISLAKQFKRPFREEAAWWVSLRIVTVGLMAGFIALAFQTAQPDFISDNVELLISMQHMMDQEAARSELFQYALQWHAAMDGARFWIGQQLEQALPTIPLAAVLTWALLFIKQFLFALGWLLLLVGLLSRDTHYD